MCPIADVEETDYAEIFVANVEKKGQHLKPVVSISAYGTGETTYEKNRGEDHMRSSKLWYVEL